PLCGPRPRTKSLTASHAFVIESLTTATSFAPLHKRRRPPLAVAGAVISATDASSPQWRLKMVALRQIAAPCMIRLVIGQSPRRKEDERLITGRGRFIDDIVLPGLL